MSKKSKCLKCGDIKWVKKPCVSCGCEPSYKDIGAWAHNVIYVCSVRCAVDYDSGQTRQKILREHNVNSYEEIIERDSPKTFWQRLFP